MFVFRNEQPANEKMNSRLTLLDPVLEAAGGPWLFVIQSTEFLIFGSFLTTNPRLIEILSGQEAVKAKNEAASNCKKSGLVCADNQVGHAGVARKL